MSISTSLTNLSLFIATPEQVLESRLRSSNEWKRSLAKEQYVQRDIIMDGHEHAAGGKGTTWVLAPRDNPTTLDFMCSCETFRRTGAIVTPSSSHAQDVVAYAIASVFTPPDKRRQGYAQHMMRLLHWVLAPRSALKVDFPAIRGAPPLVPAGFGNAQFSVLYSDIGKEFYRTCGPSPEAGQGWVERGSAQTAWDFTTQDKTHRLSNRMAPRWEYLSEDDAKAVWSKDAEWMKADLAAAASPTGHTLFTFLPDRGVGAFLIHRAMSFSEDSDMTPVLPLEKWGAMLMPQDGATLSNVLDHSNRETCTFATWTVDKLTSSRTLVVTRLRADAETLPNLLRKLIDFARQEQVERVEIWALTEAFRSIAERLGWVTEQRQEHLSAFKWYGEVTDDQVEWMFNEKFCWC